MREIKFRVWDNTSGNIGGQRMIDWEEVLEMDTITETLLLVEVLGGGIRDAIPMQYTGAKDKDGTDIYEGDILFSGASLTQILGVVTWNEETSAFAVRSVDNPESLSDHLYGAGLATVAGNIYQHPGLLK